MTVLVSGSVIANEALNIIGEQVGFAGCNITNVGAGGGGNGGSAGTYFGYVDANDYELDAEVTRSYNTGGKLEYIVVTERGGKHLGTFATQEAFMAFRQSYLGLAPDKKSNPQTVSKTQESKVANESEKEIIPDISLARVGKWAVVLIVLMALGNRFWTMFGPKVQQQLHKALGDQASAATPAS